MGAPGAALGHFLQLQPAADNAQIIGTAAEQVTA
jgi:hypothetical protein